MPQTFVLPKQVGIISAEISPAAVLRFFRTGTSTPQSAYLDSALQNSVINVTADSDGVFPKVYLDPLAVSDYRVTLEDSSGVISYTEDGISRIPFSQAQVGAALYPVTDAEDAVTVTPLQSNYPEGHVFR